jgi:t-SNARE complex subunit (syntaxin)
LLASSRNTAIQGIEMAIQEIGAIYQQLAHMVSEQGEMVQRIDMNMEEMQLNVQRGQEQLLRYLRSISGNRGLIIKLFVVAIIFILIYAIFLA